MVHPRSRARAPYACGMGTALVTGASAGLGLEFAWQLATARHDVVLVARDVPRLERLAGQLNAAAGVRAEVLPADLSVREDVERVAERLRRAERPVGLLVNNAGYSTGDSFLGSDLDFQERALDVMVRAVMVLSHEAATRDGRPRPRGDPQRLVRGGADHGGDVLGAQGLGPGVHRGPGHRAAGTGVTATALCPGLTHTEFHERAGVDRSRYPDLAWLNADTVVSAALADVRRGAVISTPSLRYGVISEVARLLPRAAIRRFSDSPAMHVTPSSDAED